MRCVPIVEALPTMRAKRVSWLEDLDAGVKIMEVESGFEALRMLPRERVDRG